MDIILRILPSTPARFLNCKGVSGFALVPASGEPGHVISIFHDRIEEMAFQKLDGVTRGIFASALPHTSRTGLVLGTVMAHEIGHLLLGAGSHSRQGIMRPNWNRQDLEEAYCGRQTFTKKQVKQLRADIMDRPDRKLTILAAGERKPLDPRTPPPPASPVGTAQSTPTTTNIPIKPHAIQQKQNEHSAFQFRNNAPVS